MNRFFLYFWLVQKTDTMKKVLISIVGVVMIAVVLVLFINARRADKTAPCCPEATKVEVVEGKAACPEMAGSEKSACQQTCQGAAVATK